MQTAYLGLGSNEGDRLAHLRAAVEGIDGAEGTRVTGVSAVYETEAHTLEAGDDQPAYLNAVIRIETEQSPEQLLATAQALEPVRQLVNAQESAAEDFGIDPDSATYKYDTGR